jgi:hypothetical protein
MSGNLGQGARFAAPQLLPQNGIVPRDGKLLGKNVIRDGAHGHWVMNARNAFDCGRTYERGRRQDPARSGYS